MSTIKVSVKELKEVVAWFESHTNEEYIRVTIDNPKLFVDGRDKSGQDIEITLFSQDVSMMPKIMKTDIFPVKR